VGETKPGEEKAVTSSRACTPQRADGLRGKGDRKSIRSDASIHEASSCTESERALGADGKARQERPGLPGEGTPLKTYLQREENRLPEKAAQVFSPALTVPPSHSAPKDEVACWEIESEKSPFLNYTGVDYGQHGFQYEWTESRAPTKLSWMTGVRDILKVGVSLMMSALIFPVLVWGGFVFLPFDAPLLDSAPLRLVYTLRCSVFAAAPIVLGKSASTGYLFHLNSLGLPFSHLSLTCVTQSSFSLYLKGSLSAAKERSRKTGVLVLVWNRGPSLYHGLSFSVSLLFFSVSLCMLCFFILLCTMFCILIGCKPCQLVCSAP
uniref:Transmembrane protein n=1 Tax=Oryzias sinensis TaxID=183150 RepID=A0A8C7WS08_9TELE